MDFTWAHEVHVGSSSGFGNGGGIVGVILSRLELQAARRDEVGGDDAGVQTHGVLAPMSE